ncbi:MAG: hypothetical protein IPM16_14840 [Chloroflexi bacterium]|nr:hypothetical protein [Chloroflexota bacterium]
MSARVRVLIILLGAVIVIGAFAFPVWFPLTLDPSEIVLFPEIPESLQDEFEALPADRRDNYLELRDEDVRIAANMAAFALQPPRVVPEDEQANPERSGQVAIRDGEFETITPNRSAQGTITLYELPDGSRYLWLQDFSVIPGPGLRLFLSDLDGAMLEELLNDDEPGDFRLSLNELLLDPLRYDVGNQAYDVPREADLGRYSSVIIYSTELDVLYSFAEW